MPGPICYALRPVSDPGHPLTADSTIITDRRELVAHLASGCKPADEWLIGTEHEKFGFNQTTLEPLPYEGLPGIEAMLTGLTQFDWNPVEENGRVIALSLNGASITLEPGGQFELSGAPLDNIHQTCDEVHRHLQQVREVGNGIGAGFIGLGFHPTARREDIHWMPKARYKIMRDYMPKVGTLGLDMMTRTCTVQVNLDFASETDMVKKFRVGLALQPVATALFANSPFTEGEPNGFLSYRSHIWTDTDPDRSGMLGFVFESGMGFERYTDYALDVPMYFVYRNGKYVDAAGQSFRDFLEGKLPALPGERPTMTDWENHLTTIFPEVRLKRFLEMRGADGGPWRRLCALPAFWVGLLYDADALDGAWGMAKDWSLDQREQLRLDVPKLGLRAEIAGRSVQSLALELLALANAGLARRARLNSAGDNETGFLSDLNEIAASGMTPAEKKLDAYRSRWNHSVEPIFEEFAY